MARPAKRAAPPPPPLPSLIRDMPPEERPRQRLLRSGGESLFHAEVLALVLGNGCREVCSLELARSILDETGGLPGLVGIRPDTLQRRGLGEAKAAAVLAAFGFRLMRTSGRHMVFAHPGVVDNLNLQPRRGVAKPYQIRQFLALVEQYNLRLGGGS